jgi:hypothetical protein
MDRRIQNYVDDYIFYMNIIQDFSTWEVTVPSYNTALKIKQLGFNDSISSPLYTKTCPKLGQQYQLTSLMVHMHEIFLAAFNFFASSGH